MTAKKPLTICNIADADNMHAKRWLGYFQAQGHRVYCLSDRPGDIPGVTIISIPDRNTLFPPGKKYSKDAFLKARAQCIQKHIQQIQPDILHAHFLTIHGWSAAMTGFHPLVITLWGSDIYLPKGNYKNMFQRMRDQWLNRQALLKADLITGVSPGLCEETRKIVGSKVPIEKIPLGIDLAQFQALPQPSRLADIRNSLHIPPEAFVLLSPRAMAPLYNINLIIEAMPQVLSQVPHAVLVLKDTVPDKHKIYVNELKALAESLGVSHALRWVGEVPYEDMPLYYHLANAVVSIPSSDGQPVTLFEAMACGKPVVIGDLSVYDGFITHGENGLRVSLKDSKDIAKAMIQLASNPEQAKAIATCGQKTAMATGDIHQHLAKMEALYYALAKKNSKAH